MNARRARLKLWRLARDFWGRARTDPGARFGAGMTAHREDPREMALAENLHDYCVSGDWDRLGDSAKAEWCSDVRPMLAAADLCDPRVAQLAEAEKRVKQLERQIEDWVPMLDTDKPLFSTSRDGTIGISMRGARKLIAVMSAAMAKMLGDATNYVEIDAKAAGGPRYILRVQRDERPTPHQLRQQAEAERDSLRAALTHILGIGCESYTRGMCRTNGKTKDAKYGADRWCDACVAADALGISSDRTVLAALVGSEQQQ